jgi:threonine/homoserine/homoserine lactone efflux protein
VAWFSLYIVATNQLGKWLRTSRVRAWIEHVAGAVLIGVAVKLATTAASA